MSFRTENKSLTFSDLEISQKEIKNSNLKTLNQLTQTITWKQIEDHLIQNYAIGKKKIGNTAYPPLMLFKCLLLKHLYSIQSDSKLEALINDRFSFKKFVGLAFYESSPDSSTFSRFRKRITKNKIQELIEDVFEQFSLHHLTLKKRECQ